MKISKMVNVNLDEYCDKSYLSYKLSNSWINSRLKKCIDSSIYNGTSLYDVEKMYMLWNNKRPYCIYDDSISVDFDYSFYIIKDVYGWGVPCKETIDLISEYADNRVIFDIGCGTGIMSAILQHRHNVISLDNKSERFDFEYVDIKKCDVIFDDIYGDEKNPFVLLVYPRNQVLYHSFRKASIGTRFYIHIPFIAANSEFMNIAAQVILNSVVHSCDVKSWISDDIRHYDGVIIEKVSDFEYDDGFNIVKHIPNFSDNSKWYEFKKSCYDSSLDWCTFVQICNTINKK